MIGVTLLDVEYYTITAIEALILAALVVLAAAFVVVTVEQRNRQRRTVRRSRTVEYPSNVTVLYPEPPRVFDWAEDAS